ncbi:hypothetical protein D0Z00_000511 [Geotrichum galactomycetum]|uniref:Uncharacterized protein n=1 Tax=Geotrichum galactomycetum TaxID=27317 RepID=A0ACB6V9M5_9ASCO|nr:hypothetical protein D0Z00_000511 [Geotrichum candidum]
MALNLQIVNGLTHIHKNFAEFQLDHPTVKRRCSVAIILRFPGIDIPANTKDVQHVFDLVKQESSSQSAEILFIKRTSRKGDRWSGHVALPGGKRDPEDESDLDAAQRETIEEVGIDLAKHGLLVGPLDQRFVKTSWGRVTLMTLCPYIFLVSGVSTPPLKLQPTEIDRAFWVPVSQLFGSQAGTSGYEIVPLGDRLRLHERPLIPRFLHPFIKSWVIGSMRFNAVNLMNPLDMEVSAFELEGYDAVPAPTEPQLPYKLWGLTYGIILDLLEIIRPKTEIANLSYPTMQAPDLRLILAILTFNFRRKKQALFKSMPVPYQEGKMDLTGIALDGYFKYLAKGIIIGLALRATVMTLIIYKLFIKFVKRQ